MQTIEDIISYYAEYQKKLLEIDQYFAKDEKAVISEFLETSKTNFLDKLEAKKQAKEKSHED